MAGYLPGDEPEKATLVWKQKRGVAMASTPAATEKVEMLKVLFALSDPSEFGDDDPFGAVAGGIEGMIGLLVSRDDVTVQQVPREKNPYSMLKLGQLAGQANLGVIEQLTLGNFVECGFGEAMHEKYEKGFTSAEKAVASAAAQAGVASKIASAAGSSGASAALASKAARDAAPESRG